MWSLLWCPAQHLPSLCQAGTSQAVPTGWDVHSQLLWCVARAGMDNSAPREAALFSHARIFRMAYDCRVLEPNRILPWDLLTV